MNKRLIACIAVGLIMVPLASAQFKAGILGGATFAQVDGDQLSGYNKSGLFGGIYVNYPVKKHWEAGFEILYIMKGSKETTDPDNPKPTLFRLRYDYIEFPLKVSYVRDKFTAYAGPTIGVNVQAKRDELGLGWMDADIRKMEFGSVIGAHYHLSDRFGIGLRHQNSLVRVGDAYPNGLNIWYRAGLYNRLFGVYAVVHFAG